MVLNRRSQHTHVLGRGAPLSNITAPFANELFRLHKPPLMSPPPSVPLLFSLPPFLFPQKVCQNTHSESVQPGSRPERGSVFSKSSLLSVLLILALPQHKRLVPVQSQASTSPGNEINEVSSKQRQFASSLHDYQKKKKKGILIRNLI